MKKTFKTMLALMAGALVFTACSNDDIPENIDEQKTSALKPMTFTASFEGQDGGSRAVIDGLDIKWVAGDKISIFDGSDENYGNQEFTLTDGGAGSASGTFTGMAAEDADTYYALYPYVSPTESRVPTEGDALNAAGREFSRDFYTWQSNYNSNPDGVVSDIMSKSISAENQAIILAYLKGEPMTMQRNFWFFGGNISGVVFPATQIATAGSADPNAMLMTGISDNANNIPFKNVCAYVKVTPDFDCTSIVLKSKGTERLAGIVMLGHDTDGNPTINVTDNSTNTVTLTGTIAANSTYYIAVLPETLESGFTIYFHTTDGTYQKSTSKSVTFTRNEVLNLGSFKKSTLPHNTTGTATRTGGYSVNWVQLWKDGPRFAEYNVGTNSATEYGGYYCWGGYIDKDPEKKYKGEDTSLIGIEDAAHALWGSNWRMPTWLELDALVKNCTCILTVQNGVKGLLCTGKNDYSCNSIFLPAAGVWGHGEVEQVGDGFYWSSTDTGYEKTDEAFCLTFGYAVDVSCFYLSRSFGMSVRAVLAL